MAQRTGSANLPLHTGRVPPWLAQRMTRLGVVISQAIVHHYGRDELLRRVGQPKEVMIDTLSWLIQTSGATGGGGFLSTHPATADRIEALRRLP